MTDTDNQIEINDSNSTTPVIHEPLEKVMPDEIAASNSVTQDVNDSPENETAESNGPFGLVLIAVCFSVVALALATWNIWGNKVETYRVVDLAEISKFYQEQAREQGLKDGVTNEQRGMILGRLQAQMGALKAVTEDYAKECDCTLFVRSAIVADNGNSIDVSNEIVTRINKAVESTGITPLKIPETPSPFTTPEQPNNQGIQ